jgi:S1-C subfamily serine protease
MNGEVKMKTRNHAKLLVLLFLAAASLSACSRPVYEVDGQPLSYAHTADPLTHIEDSIVRAARRLGWIIKRQGDWRFLATKRLNRRFAAVYIDYDEEIFSIKYRTSRNWRAKKVKDPDTGENNIVIHRRYNSLVRRLHKEIEKQLWTPQRTARSPQAPDVYGQQIPPKPAVEDQDPAAKRWGTGFYVSGNGDIVTNRHVVSSCISYQVRTLSAGRHEAQLIAADQSVDLALLRTDYKPSQFAKLRSGHSVRSGEPVTGFGFPLPDKLSSQGVATTGTVSALRGIKGDPLALQISAPLQPGNSGGPLFDASGNVVGVVFLGLNTVTAAIDSGYIPQNVNFAIKRYMLENFLSLQAVDYKMRRGQKPLKAADIVKQAKKFVVQVECLQ